MSLKAPASVASVQPLLSRSAELRSAQPIVAYYAKIQAIEQVLETKLHLQDESVAAFATELMNEIEKDRKEGALAAADTAEILEDETASEAYVMNFVTELFEKAEKQVDQGKATRNTGSAFLASATLLGLQSIWSPLTDEVRDKIKYAKYHAARILRAIKAGEDPNKGVEVQESVLEPINDDTSTEQNVETLASADTDKDEIRPIDVNESENPENVPKLPSVPHELIGPEDENGLSLPQTPSTAPNDLGLPEAPGDQPSVPFDYDPAPKVPKPTDFASAATPPPQQRKPSVVKPKPATALDVNKFLDESKVINESQKHARFAISALNYEDLNTAVKELKEALAILERYQGGHS